jgi:hypothetical protein
MGHNASVTLFDVSELLGPGTVDEPAGEVSGPGTRHVPDHEGTDESRGGTASHGRPEIEVRVSARRRKTSEATWVGGRIVVSVPAHLDREVREQTVDWLVERLLTRHRLHSAGGDDALFARAITLSDRYCLGARPVSVRWVTNQTARWGSCSYYSREIRISHRLQPVPGWVLDSVLVHEMAHLTYPDHSPGFHRLAGSYPRHEEAGVFLAGYGLGLSNPIA